MICLTALQGYKMYKIQNEIIRKAMWGDIQCKSLKLEGCTGYLESGIDVVGRNYLEYIYSIIFNIHRLPGYEAPFGVGTNQCKLKRVLNNITAEDIQDSVQELKNLYEYTQDYLKKEKISDNGYIILERTLNMEQAKEVRNQLEKKSNKITLPVNILTSYGMPGVPHGYNGTKIFVRRKIPVEKIVMIYKCLEYPNDTINCGFITRDEACEYEVWVVEDDYRGECVIHKDEIIDFSQNQDKGIQTVLEDQHILGIGKTKRAKSGPLFAHCEIRPCEMGRITPLLVKHNSKKIKKWGMYIE